MSDAKTAGLITAASLIRIGEEAGRHNRARDQAISDGIDEANARNAIIDRYRGYLADLTFTAKSQIHSLRTTVGAHELVEDELIAVIKDLEPDHPLADKDVVVAMVMMKRNLSGVDPVVIKRTYPDGKIPEGAVVMVGDMRICDGGEPAYPWQPGEEAAFIARKALLDAFEVDAATADTVVGSESLLSRVQARIASIERNLEEDSKKGFFSSMSKKSRAGVVEDLARFNVYLGTAKVVVTDAHKKVETDEKAEIVKAKVERALAKLGKMAM
jgi:hypothetical protein